MASILVTGASRGIGLELACQYAEGGDKVIATCRDPETANALRHLQQSHSSVEVFALDVVDPVSVLSLASLLSKRGEKLDMLINNAGLLVSENPGEWSAEGFSATLETNVVGPAVIMQAFANVMAAGGNMVNISSALGSFGLAIDFGGSSGTYSASKVALNMVVCQLALFLAKKGITVTAFSPGWVKTDMGGQEAELTTQEAVTSLRESFAKLAPEHSGKFFSYDFAPLPW